MKKTIANKVCMPRNAVKPTVVGGAPHPGRAGDTGPMAPVAAPAATFGSGLAVQSNVRSSWTLCGVCDLQLAPLEVKRRDLHRWYKGTGRDDLVQAPGDGVLWRGTLPNQMGAARKMAAAIRKFGRSEAIS